jgi:hypothetical protein
MVSRRNLMLAKVFAIPIILTSLLGLGGCASADNIPLEDLQPNTLLKKERSATGILAFMSYAELMEAIETLQVYMPRTATEELGLVGLRSTLLGAHKHMAGGGSNFDIKQFSPRVQETCDNGYYNACKSTIITGRRFELDTVSDTIPTILRCVKHEVTSTTTIDVVLLFSPDDEFLDLMIHGEEKDRPDSSREEKKICFLADIFEGIAREAVTTPLQTFAPGL